MFKCSPRSSLAAMILCSFGLFGFVKKLITATFYGQWVSALCSKQWIGLIQSSSVPRLPKVLRIRYKLVKMHLNILIKFGNMTMTHRRFGRPIAVWSQWKFKLMQIFCAYFCTKLLWMVWSKCQSLYLIPLLRRNEWVVIIKDAHWSR